MSRATLHPHDDDLAALETAAAEGPVSPALALDLAWALRQRDRHRADRLAVEVIAAVPGTALAAAALLVRAEIAWLGAALGQAEAWRDEAAGILAAAGDWIGAGDAGLLGTFLALDRGIFDQRLTGLIEGTRQLYRRGGDPARAAIADAWGALVDTYVDPTAAATHLDRIAVTEADVPAVGPLLAAARGVLAGIQDDRAAAAAAFAEAAARAPSFGLIRLAITSSGNEGLILAGLDDLEGASRAQERALELARLTGSPILIGCALTQLGRLLGDLDQGKRATEVLTEARDWLKAAPDSRNYAVVCRYLGEAALNLGEPARAFEAFASAVACAVPLGQPDEELGARIGQARAQAAIGEPAAALATATSALARSREIGFRISEIQALRALAEIYAGAPDLIAPDGRTAREAALAVLEEAWALAGHSATDGRLLAALSVAWEQAGDLARALQFERQARAAFDAERHRKASTRAQVMSLRHETERNRLAADHHRRLAEAEGSRARTLEMALDTLDQLGRIGQEITGTLDTASVFAALTRHLGALLHAPSVSIYLLDGNELVLRHGVEPGGGLPQVRIRLDDPMSTAAACARSQREIIRELAEGEAPPMMIPDTQRMVAALFGPLAAGERVLGVLSIQSDRKSAYGERERLIFQSLCAYGAIALANSEAYRALDSALVELRETQEQLVVKGKMAALGQMVAGIAHEIQNPLNFVNNFASLSVDLLDELGDVSDEAAGDTAELLQMVRENLTNIRAHGSRASAIVRSMLQHSRGGEGRVETVDLNLLLRDAVSASLGEDCAPLRIDWNLDAAAPRVSIVPQDIHNVLTNLIRNSAYALRQRLIGAPANWRPTLTLSSRVGAGEVEIRVRDNGPGMPETVRANLFTPFFTTKPTGEGTGLGLSLSYDIVVKRHRGRLSIQSEEGVYTEAIIQLPTGARG